MPEAEIPDEAIEFAETFRGVGVDRERRRITLVFGKGDLSLYVSVPENAAGRIIASLLAAAVHEQSQIDSTFTKLLPGSSMSSTEAMFIEQTLVGDKLADGRIPIVFQLQSGIRFDLMLGHASAVALRNGLTLSLGPDASIPPQ